MWVLVYIHIIPYNTLSNARFGPNFHLLTILEDAIPMKCLEIFSDIFHLLLVCLGPGISKGDITNYLLADKVTAK